MLFFIIIVVLVLILFIPIPLKLTVHYSQDRYYIKFYNINIVSNDDGIIRKFLNKRNKKDNSVKKKTTKVKSKDKAESSEQEAKKSSIIDTKALAKQLYINIKNNKFKPSIKLSSDISYSLGDASRTAIFLGVFYNINPILLYIFSIVFKVKLLKTDFNPIFKDKLFVEFTLSCIITFNLAQIINMGIIVFKCVFDKSIIKNRR